MERLGGQVFGRLKGDAVPSITNIYSLVLYHRIQTHFSLLSDLTKSGKSKLGVSWWRGGVGLFALHQK